MSPPSAQATKQRVARLLLAVMLLASKTLWMTQSADSVVSETTEKMPPQIRRDPMIAANALYLAGDRDAADAAFERIIQDPKSSPEACRQALLARGYLSPEHSLGFFLAAEKLVDKEKDPLTWTDIQTEFATLLIKEHRHGEALPLLREILRLREAHLDPFHPTIFASLDMLANATMNNGDVPQAMAVASLIFAKTASLHGQNHPELIKAVDQFARKLAENHHSEAAATYMSKSLAIFESTLNPDPMEILNRLGAIVNQFERADLPASAEPHARRILALYEQNPESTAALSANTLMLLGNILDKAQRHQEAETIVSKAYEIQSRYQTSKEVAPLSIMEALADHFINRGQLQEAENLYRRSLELRNHDIQSEIGAIPRGFALNRLAEILDAMDRLPEAEPILLEASQDYMEHSSRPSEIPPTQELIIVTANYLRTARALQRSDEEAYARLNATRAQTKLSQTKFEELWQDVLATIPP